MPVRRRTGHNGTRHPGSRTGRLIAALGAVLATAALALIPATTASAHDYLVGSDPAANTVQTTPIQKVSLTFNDVVLHLSSASSLVQVVGPGDKHFETACPAILDRVVTTKVALGAPGKYTVTWQVVSADGHVVSSSISFEYKPAAGTVEAKGSATGPDCGSVDKGAAKTAATPPPQNTVPNSVDLGIVLTIAGVIVGLAIVGVVVILLTSRRRRQD